MKEVVMPALDSGVHVVTDRFDSSTHAYQLVARNNPGWRTLFYEMRRICLEGYAPDVYVIFDGDPEVFLSRRHVDSTETINRFDREKLDFHRRVRRGFNEFIEQFPHDVVDAERPPDDVRKSASEIIRRVLEGTWRPA